MAGPPSDADPEAAAPRSPRVDLQAGVGADQVDTELAIQQATGTSRNKVASNAHGATDQLLSEESKPKREKKRKRHREHSETHAAALQHDSGNLAPSGGAAAAEQTGSAQTEAEHRKKHKRRKTEGVHATVWFAAAQRASWSDDVVPRYVHCMAASAPLKSIVDASMPWRCTALPLIHPSSSSYIAAHALQLA